MESLKMISNYKDITEYRLSFNELAKLTFGIDFEKWYQEGCWSDSYICYSYVDGERVVANVAINKMKLLIAGKEYRALQIGTVMTHPDYRRRGLAASLMKTVFAEYEKEFDLIFLFPDEDAMEFYRKFEFEPIKLYQFTAEVEGGIYETSKVRKLDPAKREDLQLIVQMAEERVPISRIFDAKDTQHIVSWYCFNLLPNDIYYLEDEDVIVFFRRKNAQVQVFDVISRREFDLDRVISQISSQDTKEVEFHFTPSKTSFECVSEESEEVLFIRPALKGFDAQICFPFTARA